MGKEFRKVGAAAEFNTGMSRSQAPRGKVKGLILVERGQVIDATSRVSLEKSFHANRPNRAYPVKLIDEYAPSGGEAQVSAQGYGANKVTGYSAFSEVYTLNEPDGGLRANVLGATGLKLDMYIVTEHNVIYGQKNEKGEVGGIPLSGIHVGGQSFDSSGQVANLTITVLYQDIEKHWKEESQVFCDFNAVDALNGIVSVELVKCDTDKYRIREKYGKLDITPYLSSLLTGANANRVWNGVTAVTYEDGFLVATAASGDISLKSASELYENEVTGIEQVGAVVVLSTSDGEGA